MQLQNRLSQGLNPIILPTNQEYQTSSPSQPLKYSEGISLLEALPNIVWVADGSGAIAYLNQQWFNFTGLKGSDSLEDTFWQAIHPEDRLLTRQKWNKAVKKQEFYQTQCRLRRLDGFYYWFLCQAKPIIIEEGREIQWVGTYTRTNSHNSTTQAIGEIIATDKVSLEKQLKQMQGLLDKRDREFEQFTYLASHDLKSPLRAISNLAEWLEEDLMDLLPVESQHQLKMLRRRVQRMEMMIEGLLEYSRVGKIQHPVELVDVSALISEIVDRLEPPPQFLVEVAAPMPIFTTKKAPLAQVFTHLIDNAIKHHPRYDGRVYISVQDRGKFYEFAVKDDGLGIDLRDGDRIFTMFNTVSSRDTLETAGMGLAIVKKILETEGCKISLESELDRGSVFQFTWLK
ncbi:PAS domain-containing sensor histidine kinase [Merismopedia glauca]|uniref:histidine kinase n=1 Tax=Merismopedia glauca CCAP 1448/3 TaxID=1296344 RepID=A0A2T1CAR5_9CYAN|nr:PAS domain-containing sensor histidine kinase [Merismopedia glauca]PSB05237.1 PAS domain-containing sensor histidine kinase [Merismopedia glauca CCAP 1448/3]